MKKIGLTVLALLAVLSVSSPAKADRISGSVFAKLAVENGVAEHNGKLATGSALLRKAAVLPSLSQSKRMSAIAIAPSTIPEPGSLLLLGATFAGLALVVLRKAKSSDSSNPNSKHLLPSPESRMSPLPNRAAKIDVQSVPVALAVKADFYGNGTVG